MKVKVFSLSMITLLTLSAVGVIFASVSKENVDEVEAYTVASLPTTIDLNYTNDTDIRDYYSELSNNQKTGTDALISLKSILKNGQKYYSYDSGDNVWRMYEITDRDWSKSPASNITNGTYNANTNVITNYQYRASEGNDAQNPFIHALYINRDVDNLSRAWGNHEQDQWGINREHVWPKSQGFDTKGSNSTGGARGDPMHLMAGNGYANNKHSNHYYGNVDKTKKYTNIGSTYSNLAGNFLGISRTMGSGTVFEPQDCDKGDIARAVFYMAARYNNIAKNDNTIDGNNPNLSLDNNINTNTGTSSANTPFSLGVLTDLLEWNRLDPPDEYEILRNDLLYTNFTNNRNPFIDFPDWADYIWGDKAGSSYLNPSSDRIHNFSSGGGEEPPQQDIAVTSVSLLSSVTIKVGESFLLTPEISPYNATNKNVSWLTDNADVVTVLNGKISGVAVGTTNVTVTTQDQNKTATCIVTVVNEDVDDSSTDTLTLSSTGVSGNSYKSWSGPVNGPSGAVYNGACAGSYSSIQLRNKSDDENKIYSGIVSTSSPGYIKKINVDWNSNTTSGRSITIYGKNTAYSGSQNLYGDADAKGQSLGIIKKGTSTELTIDGDYQYVGISATDPIYLNSITFEWEILAASIELDIDSVELDLAGENTATISATILPSNATNKNVLWYTSDANVATVNNGVITAVGVGEAEVIAVAQDGQYEAYCNVAVIDTSAPIAEDVTIENTILALSKANGWTNSSPYGVGNNNAIALDENISFYTTGNGDNGKYYDKGYSWRLYANGSGNIIIKAANDCIIKSVILNFSLQGDASFVNSESQALISGEPNEVNSSIVEYTVSSGKIWITGVSVTYESNGQAIDKNLTSISISNYITSFAVGDTFAFGGIVTANFDNETSQNVTGSASFSGYNMSNTGNQTITVSYTYKEVTKTATYQINVTDSPYLNGVQYKLYLEKSSTNYYFSGSMVNTYYGSTSATYTDGFYVYFEQNGNGQNLYFFENDEKGGTKQYIYVSINGNHINFTYSSSAPTSVWKYDSIKGCIYYTIESTRYTIGNFDSYSTFAAYLLSDVGTQNHYMPQLAETAESFSQEFLNKIACDSTGNTSPIYQDGFEWDDFKSIYNNLDEVEQNILKSTETNESGTITEQAMAKYEYIAGKYHLENFIAERTPKSFPYRYVSAEVEKNNVLLAIAVIVTTSAVAVGLYALIAKKKRK